MPNQDQCSGRCSRTRLIPEGHKHALSLYSLVSFSDMVLCVGCWKVILTDSSVCSRMLLPTLFILPHLEYAIYNTLGSKSEWEAA